MFPIAFLGSFGFMTAAITRSGNSTDVVMVVAILFFWIATGEMERSRWNLFRNPFADVGQLEALSWTEMIRKVYEVDPLGNRTLNLAID